MVANILLDSTYYKFWNENVDLRDSTIKSQTSILRQFGRYIEKGGDTTVDFDHFFYDDDGNNEPIDEEYFDEYFDHLLDCGKSKSVLYGTISCLKNFLQFLADNNLIRKNCLSYYHNPYYSLKRQDKMLSLDECQRLLQTALRYGLMYYVLVLTLLRCGLRAKELCCLKISNLQLQSSLIYVVEGQKTFGDTVLIHPILRVSFERYLKSDAWQVWKQNNGKHVFFEDGEPLTPAKLERLLKKLSNVAGVRLVKPHDFRHTMPNLMYLEGASMQTIQRQMRHARMETTLHYMTPSFVEVLNQVL